LKTVERFDRGNFGVPISPTITYSALLLIGHDEYMKLLTRTNVVTTRAPHSTDKSSAVGASHRAVVTTAINALAWARRGISI
jgi:hypothetical protein